MHNAKICYAEPSSAKLDVTKLETRGSSISRGSNDLDEIVTAEPEYWSTPLINLR
jgi:hypothetical protein